MMSDRGPAPFLLIFAERIPEEEPSRAELDPSDTLAQGTRTRKTAVDQETTDDD
jgi:hypothetical protein